jgi:aminopeptidase YwaD
LTYLQNIKDMPSLCINLDGVGDVAAPNAVSFYGCPQEIEAVARETLIASGTAVEGESWVAGDHSIFTMQRIPALALTTADMVERWRTVAHTPNDTIERLDPARLVDLAMALSHLLKSL